jgi:alpha-galactosidase
VDQCDCKSSTCSCSLKKRSKTRRVERNPAATRDILVNQEVLAVDQDSAGIQGTLVAENPPELQVWAKPLRDGSRAVVLLNRSSIATAMTVTWWRIGLPAGAARVRDLWAHADRGTFTNRFSAPVPPHAVVMVRITPESGT